MIKRTINVLKSFNVKEFNLELDTGSYTWNALLYPSFYFLRGPHRLLRVNYEGRNRLKVTMENRLIYILYSLIK